MVELKPDKANKKHPWMVWIVVLLLLIGCGFFILKRWQSHELMEHVRLIDNTPGILITSIDTLGLEKIQLEVLRDPAAQLIQEWLEQQWIDTSWVMIKERAYL